MMTHDFWQGVAYDYTVAGGILTLLLPDTESAKYSVGDNISTERISAKNLPAAIYRIESIDSREEEVTVVARRTKPSPIEKPH